jgi:hypothetical protein
VGAGIRPQPFFVAKTHICVEPHHEYANWLWDHGYQVLRATALEVLRWHARVDAIFMLDVIEHMSRLDGEAVLAMARDRAPLVVIYTPLGFREQSYGPGEKDAWGMHGAEWQTHRSGWEPGDFPGATILADHDAFFAIFGP